MKTGRHCRFPSLSAEIVLILLLSCALSSRPPIARAQTAAAGGTPTFRAGTQEVIVDVTVVSRKGNAVMELTRQDFRILEDGKEQTITSFSHEGKEISGHSASFIALVFESEHPGLRQEVIRFIDRIADWGVYLAVYSRVNDEMRLQQGFTQDANRIRAALQNMPPTPTSAKDVDPRKHTDLFERLSVVGDAMSRIRGRKSAILFSYGLFGERSGAILQADGTHLRSNRPEPPVVAHLRKLADDCNAGNILVYGFIGGRPRAMEPGSFYDRPQEADRDNGGTTDFIRDLVTATGGRYGPVGAYDVASFMDAVAGAANDYYLLGYTPPSARKNKPCHKLVVKVSVSGLDVIARDSYCTSSEMAVP